MYAQLKAQLSPGGKTYLFLDEVQEIKGWERSSILWHLILMSIYMSPAPTPA